MSLMASETTSGNNPSPDNEIVKKRTCRGNVGLPEDLVIEILLRLSLKSLMRFKTVCKPWKLLINSPGFIDEHSKHPHEGLFVIRDDGRDQPTILPHPRYGSRPKPTSSNQGSILVGRRSVQDYDLPFDVKYSVGTCNGIICFRIDGQKPLVLFNPCTRECSFIPEECKASNYAFCYLSQTQEYKVFCLSILPGCRSSVAYMKILTLGMKTTSFRKVRHIDVPGQIKFGIIKVAICETCMVYIAYDHEDRKDILVCYDLFEDRFSRVDLPHYPIRYSSDRFHFSVRGLDNSVILFVYPDEDATYFDIWTLVNDGGSKGESWIKYKKVGPSEPLGIIYPIHVSSDLKWVMCGKEDQRFKRNEIGVLFYYDLETNQVIDDEATDSQVKIVDFVRYVESIVSPNNICSTTTILAAMQKRNDEPMPMVQPRRSTRLKFPNRQYMR